MRIFIAFLASGLLCHAACAAEGLWQPGQLPALSTQLKSLGLEVASETLSDLTGHPMGAIVGMGHCSASFVSPDGLAITNHHCVQRTLQHNSTPEQNLLNDGYLAETRRDERPGSPGSRILVTVAVKDVSGPMLEGLDADTAGLARQRTLEEREKTLVADCEAQDGYRCDVRAYYDGLEFKLIRQLEIRDVRLVYAPARSVGNFGGDIDNWMWPRHTGDFSFLRAYVAPDGSPADYDTANVPYQPEHYLAVSPSGLGVEDFVMAVGYPGSTYRHRLASEAAEVANWYYPNRKKLFEEMLAIIEHETAGRPDAAIRYASLIQGLNNVIKNYEGMIAGFAGSGLVARKQRQESELVAWLETQHDPTPAESLTRLRELVAGYRKGREQRLIYSDFLRRRAALLAAAEKLYRLSIETEKPDVARKAGFQQRDRNDIREQMMRLEHSYDPQVDRALLSHHLKHYASLPAKHRITAMDTWFDLKAKTYDETAMGRQLAGIYDQTTLGRTETRLALMDAAPEVFRQSTDPFIRLAVALYDSDLALEERAESFEGRFQYARSQYMATLAAWLADQGKPLYPDANGTLRVTFGRVSGYRPRDAVVYTPFSTVRGIIQKHTGKEPFDTPEALLAAIEQHQFGISSADESDTIPVNFLATLDSTGGSSGSAVLDARGDLVGLLFDGNYESINADWYFDPSITRSICVDIRYVIWIMDRVDGAHELLREMGIGPAVLLSQRGVN